MPDHFCIAVRLLDGTFHGRSDGGEPEWPPSPLRLFQALVAAGAAKWNERGNLRRCGPALCWLERQAPPRIFTPETRVGVKARLYVPDNVGDLLARSWSRGNEGDIAEYRTEKDVCPIRLIGGDCLHYVWTIPKEDSDFSQVKSVLLETVGSITHLGWGIDHVVASASILTDRQIAELPRVQWQPTGGDGSGTVLRCPCAGTLEGLNRRYEAFLRRAGPDNFTPVGPLSDLTRVSYRRTDEKSQPPFAAFSLLQPDASGFKPYDPVHDGMRVAGMMRHAAADDRVKAALGLSSEEVDRFILGHGEGRKGAHVPVDTPRLTFLPLPSMERRGKQSEFVGSIRRVIVGGTRGCSREQLLGVARFLSGQPLVDEHRPRGTTALLSRLPDSDPMVRRYTQASATWASVTPVILPGYDDARKYRQRLARGTMRGQPAVTAEVQRALLAKLDRRTELLIRKAISQAGFSNDLANLAQVEWRSSGFWPGTDLASRYSVPEKLRRFRRLHVRLSWRDRNGDPIAMPGPLCLGGGRFIGLGLFAPVAT